MPERIAFRMVLTPGQAEEYKKRPDELWPEMIEALHAAGSTRAPTPCRARWCPPKTTPGTVYRNPRPTAAGGISWPT